MGFVADFVEDVVDTVGDVVGGVAEAVGDVVESVVDTAVHVVEKVADTVVAVVEDPKKLAAVAISVAFPGAGTAIGQSILGAELAAAVGATATQVIGQTVLNTVVNGGNVEQALLSAGVAQMTPALAKEISSEAVSLGVDKTIANAAGKVISGTVSAAALGQDPIAALTFGAIDQATDAILNQKFADSEFKKQYDSLPNSAKIAVKASITSALTGADASTLIANQIVQNALTTAAQEVKRQDAANFFNQISKDIGFDMTDAEVNQVLQNIDTREEAKAAVDKLKEFPSYDYYKEFDGDKKKFDKYVGDTEEKSIIKFLEDKGITPTAERVAQIAKEWNIDITKPTEGLGTSVEKYKQSNVLSAEEVKQIAQSRGLDLSREEALQYAGEGNKADLTSKLNSYLDFKSEDQKQLTANSSKIASSILDSLEAEGYTPEAISKLINDGTMQKYVDTYKQAQQQTVESLRNNAIAAEQEYGKTSQEAINARSAALNAMSEFGGYGVSKDAQGNFKTGDSVIDPNTMFPIIKAGYSGYDPITGAYRVEIVVNPGSTQVRYGDLLSKQKDQPYSTLISAGESGTPPKSGGASVFGSGSGASGFKEYFPGLGLVAIDDGTGARVYEDSNGRALIAYSDGRAFIKEPNSNNITWVDLQETPRLTEELKKIDQKTIQEVDQKDKAIAEINDQIDKGFVTPTEALKLLEDQGFKPTAADAEKITGLKSPEQAAEEAKKYAEANTITPEEARQALIDAGVSNPTEFDVKALSGQYSQDLLSGKATAAKPMADIRSAVRDVVGEGGASNAAIDEIKKQMQANEAAGLGRDEALGKAVEDVANAVGTSKTDLMNLIGKTDQSLRDMFASGQQQTSADIANVQKSLTEQIAANEAAGLSRDTATSKAIQDVATNLGTTKEQLLGQIGQTEQSLRDLYTKGQQQTAQDISNLEKSLTDKIAANEAAGLSRDQATQKAIEDVASSIGTTKEQLLGQIGESEQTLRDLYTKGQQETQSSISALDAATRQKFDALTEEQKNQALALANSTKDLQGSINAVAQQTSQQIAGLSADFNAKLAASDAATQAAFAGMTAAQQAETAARVAQGESLQKSISDVQSSLGQQITSGLAGLSADFTSKLAASDAATQAEFGKMSEAQKAETAARVAQGESLQNAIAASQQATQQKIAETEKSLTGQIAGLSEQTQAQYNSLNTAQQSEVAARVKMGEDINKAIGDVSGQVSGLGSQVSGLEKELAAQKAAENAYRAQQAVQAAKAAESSRLASSGSALAGLSGLALAQQQPVVDSSIPLAKAEFLTTKGGDTGYKGLLEEFQQKVEEPNYFQDNSATAQEQPDMSPYYSYGNEMPVETILGLGGDQQTDSSESGYFMAGGGMVAPLMAAEGGFTGTRHGRYAGGGMPSPLMAAGGKMRVDFRRGDAVSGAGDGQSDDIPAMLADGEFVFPADVVAAIGNGSTKAGSDALYDMMHSIRAHVRSAKPKDLPPEIKSPLDFLKTAKKRRA